MEHKWAAALSAGLAIAGLGVGQALADVDKVKSEVTIENTGQAFEGEVRSSREFCEKRRGITLFLEQPGKDDKIARTKTDKSGDWEASPDPNLFGDFYAKARRKLNIVSGTGIVCRSSRSGTVTIVPPEG
jgi:hypothetical protein